jgi:hypothetical protein
MEDRKMDGDNLLEVYKGCRILAWREEYPFNPRKEFDNFGTMVCWHGRYELGDEQPKESGGTYRMRLACEADPGLEARLDRLVEKSREGQVVDHEVHSLVQAALDKHYVMLNLYLYDHSGITMNTSGFHCPWDSGRVGFIYASRKDVLECFRAKKLTKAVRRKAEDLLRSEVAVYDAYLTGDVYGYNVEGPDGTEEAGCAGFYGGDHEESGLLEQARAEVDCFVSRSRTRRQGKLKEMIRNKVPLEVRGGKLGSLAACGV